MDMGTGKTPIAIRAMRYRYFNEGIHKVLIFAPKSIIFNWKQEIRKFIDMPPSKYIVETLEIKNKKKALVQLENFYNQDYQRLKLPELRRKIVHPQAYKMDKDELTQYLPQQKLMILLLNFDKARVYYDMLKKYHPDMLIADEAHKLRNRNAQVSKCIYQLTRKCSSRLTMTGSPICNGYEDLFMQYKIADESVFGTNYGDFEDRYIVKGGYMNYEIKGYQHEDELKQLVDETSYRVKIEECVDLPPQLPTLNLYCDLNSKAQKLYNGINKDMVTQLDRIQKTWSRLKIKHILKHNNIPYNPKESYYELFLKASNYLDTTSVELVMTKTMRLQQITGGFITTDAGEIVNVSNDKLNLLNELLEGYNRPLIIFCQFIAEIELIKKNLPKRLRVETITGKTKDKARVNNEFQRGNIDIVILQISAGSVGLNFYKASRIVFYSWNYSYDDYIQAIGRIKRNGQRSPWQIVHLIVNNSVDNKVLKCLKNKDKISKKIID
jgi:SNF2 family DNA or RNA helicase